LKLFHCFILHVTITASYILNKTLKYNMFVGRDHHVVGPALSRANISSFEIILDKFTRAEIKLFQMDVDEG